MNTTKKRQLRIAEFILRAQFKINFHERRIMTDVFAIRLPAKLSPYVVANTLICCIYSGCEQCIMPIHWMAAFAAMRGDN